MLWFGYSQRKAATFYKEQVMKKIILLAFVFMFLLAMTACGNSSGSTGVATEDTATKDETAVVERASYIVEAGGLKLKCPEDWKDKVTVDASDEKLAVSAGKTKLFDLLFNSKDGNILGTVKGETYTVVSVVYYTIEDDDPDLIKLQMDMNFILQNLEKDYDFEEGAALSKDDGETFDIETPIVTLKYPLKWKDKVTVDVSDDTVSFSDGETKLFDLIFKESKDGFLLGTYNDTPIYVKDYPVKSDDDLAMQAAINVIIEHLQKDSSFHIS